MDDRMSESLDRHITGNYGEDQLSDERYVDIAERLGIEPIKIIGALCRQDAGEIHRLETQRNRLLTDWSL